MLTLEKIAKAKFAFERSFGKTRYIPTARKIAENIIRVSNPETGAWANYNIAGTRIKCVAKGN